MPGAVIPLPLGRVIDVALAPSCSKGRAELPVIVMAALCRRRARTLIDKPTV
jgi:hypothetical protein